MQKSEQNARQEAMTEVSAVKEECAKRERIAESKAQEADKLKSHLEAVEADLSGQIDKKALNLVESKLNALQGVYEAKQRSLDSEYKALTVSHEGFLFGCLLYGILVTVFTAIRSKAFTGDFKTFFITVGNFFMWCGKSLYWLGIQASKLGDMIPQPIVATIVHWLLFIIACFGVAIVLVILAFAIMSPVGYSGRNRTAKNARWLYGIAVDLDGVEISFTADTGTYRLCADKVVCKRVYEVERILLN